MYLSTLTTKSPFEVMYQEDFYVIFEAAIPGMKMNGLYTTIDIDSFYSYKSEGCFYGLLEDLDIPKRMHIPVMMFNGIKAHSDYMGEMFPLLIPDDDYVELLRGYAETKRNSRIVRDNKIAAKLKKPTSLPLKKKQL